MSIIDNAANSVVTYDAKTSKAFSGQRLSKVIYKECKDKDSMHFKIKRDSKCVSVPRIAQVEITNNITALMPSIEELICGVQDKIIRGLVESGKSSIENKDISIGSVLEYLESNNESGRITKESVSAWFDENISEILAVALSERLGVSSTPTQEESDHVMKVLGSFKDKISGLAGGKTSYEPNLAKSLKRVLDFAPEGDALAERFQGRLDKMINSASIDLASIL